MFSGDRARSFKDNASFTINNINYARVIATRIYDVSIKNKIKELIRLLLYDYKIEYTENQNDILTVYSYRGKKRADFDGIIDGFREIVDGSCDSLEFIYRISLKSVLCKIKNFIKYFLKFSVNKIENPIFTAMILAQFYHYQKILLKTINWEEYKLVLTFCDAHGVENLVTQIASLNNIITATLQHGQYRVLKSETENADVESYENFISDYLLAWGLRTKKEFLKANIAEKRIISVGALKSFSRNERIEMRELAGIFGVVLDGNVYKTSNIKMIKYANWIATRYGLKYILRLHPKNNANDYIKICKPDKLHTILQMVENSDYTKKVDFSFVHMTGVFVELLSINSPIFMMEDVYLEDIFKLEQSTFSNNMQLEKLYTNFIHDRASFMDNQYKMYSEFNQQGDIKENYLKAIESIMKG